MQEGLLAIVQVWSVCVAREIVVEHVIRALDICLQEQGLLRLRVVLIKAAKVIELILLEGGHKSALVLLEHHLGEELAEASDVNKVDDVHFLAKLLLRTLMPLKPLHSPLEAVFLLAAAGAYTPQEVRPEVLRVVVEVLAPASDRIHHLQLRFLFVRRNDVLLTVLTATRRRWENAPNQRVLILETLVRAQDHVQGAPNHG